MCGIVGYVGDRDCAPMLVEGLRRLEYRGYDSAGLAVRAHTATLCEVRRPSIGPCVTTSACRAAEKRMSKAMRMTRTIISWVVRPYPAKYANLAKNSAAKT